MSYDDFANFRLVCKLWCNVSFPLWRKNAEIIITDNPEADERGVLSLDAFVTLLRPKNDIYKLRTQPFQKYMIKYWDLNFEDEQMVTFWNIIAPFITQLCLYRCDFKRVEDFKKVFFTLTPNLEAIYFDQSRFKSERPSDKALRFDLTRKEHLKPQNVQSKLKTFYADFLLEGEYFDEKWTVLPTTWIEFFVHFPNIKELTLKGISEDENGLMEELLECVKSIELIRDNLGSEYFGDLQLLDIID